LVRSLPGGVTEIWGIIEGSNNGAANAPSPQRRQIHQWPSLPDVDALTLGLRLAMENVEAWH
jgi:hypothetical protein